jgi:hypothetical protein
MGIEVLRHSEGLATGAEDVFCCMLPKKMLQQHASEEDAGSSCIWWRRCAGLLYGSPGFDSPPATLPRPSRKMQESLTQLRKEEYPAGEHPEEE